MISDIYFIFECIALLIVLIQYKNLKHSIYKYFLPYLICIVVYEYGSILYWFNINNSNLYITNITEIGNFLFYSIFLYNLLNNQSFKKIVSTLIPLTLFCALINMVLIQGFWKLDSITILLQQAVIIVIVCLYFYELMNSIEDEVSIVKLPAFWLNTGLLFFCLSNFLFFSSFAFMAYRDSYKYLILVRVIANVANVILYSCLSFCFLCFNKTTK